jgi:hypothetical protein
MANTYIGNLEFFFNPMYPSARIEHGFFVTMPLREFVSAGGELIIHAAAHLKNSPQLN